MFDPLLKNVAILERDSIYISSVGQNVKGTVLSVVADNLGAHSISGLVENFSGPFICRFCLEVMCFSCLYQKGACRFLEVFPTENLIPKHHFLEHYSV